MPKGGNSMGIDSLTDDLLLEILVRVPAEDIEESGRIVCRRWKRIIDSDGFVNGNRYGLVIAWERMIDSDCFVYAHFHRNCSGLLIAKFSEENSPTSVAEAQGRIQISRLRNKWSFPVLAGCNGLILGRESTGCNMRYVVNPVTKCFIANPATKRCFNLPHLVEGLAGLVGKFALAYAVSTTEYKVVTTWCDGIFSLLVQPQCAILTVGVDETWRRVPMEQLPGLAEELFFHPPIVTEGFIHWAQESDVLSMNVETEVITHTPAAPLPQDYQGEERNYYYLSAGKYLSLLISCSDDNDFFEIWELKPDSGEWRKLVNEINLKSHECRLREFSCDYVTPAGWVKYPDVLAFVNNGRGASCSIYNLDTNEINCFRASDPDSFYMLRSVVGCKA